MEAVVREMIRVTKPGGRLLLMSRGVSYVPVYNQYLQMRAATDLLEKGYVEHINFDEFIEG